MCLKVPKIRKVKTTDQPAACSTPKRGYYRLRVTVKIRTRQKSSIKAIFVAFAVALRQQGCHLKTTNLIFTTSIFDALQFTVCRFGLNQGIKRS